MGAIDARQLRMLTETLDQHEVEYLYIGKSAAIIHGFADTTQDADIYVNHSEENKQRLAAALKAVGFTITREQEADIRGGKDFIQLHNGPFDVDLIYAPDGIEKFEDAWHRGRTIEGHQVCSMDDVIASKRAANRQKDRESLSRLEEFARYLEEQPARGQRLPTLNPTWRDRVREELATGGTATNHRTTVEIGTEAQGPKPGPAPAEGAAEGVREDARDQTRQREGKRRPVNGLHNCRCTRTDRTLG